MDRATAGTPDEKVVAWAEEWEEGWWDLGLGGQNRCGGRWALWRGEASAIPNPS